VLYNLIQPTISLEMPVPSQGHYGFHSFPVVTLIDNLLPNLIPIGPLLSGKIEM
jgi:hypothetical protein